MAVLWDDAYSTGDKAIDEQHRKLFDFVNKLEVQAQQDVDRTTVDRIMEFLSMYVRLHFLHEEGCMFIHKCPVAQQNKEAHGKFLEAFEAFKERCDTEGPSRRLLEQLYGTAEKWLINHICKIDVNLRRCIKHAHD